MKKRLLSTLLALCMMLALLPATAQAANPELPDWYFLFAIFKNIDSDYVNAYGKTMHAAYTMTQDENYIARKNIERFETYMNQVGVMRAHADVIEIDRTVTELTTSSPGDSYISAKQATPALVAAGVDLDKYDHVTCIFSLGASTTYLGITSIPFENGTGHACINLRNQKRAQSDFTSSILGYPSSTFVHEFLHFMERKSGIWGGDFNLHMILEKYNPSTSDDDKSCLTNVILNRVQGNAESGTGVAPIAWQYPPRVLRNTSELNLGTDVTGFISYALYGLGNLKSVSIPASVTNIGYAAFWGTGLTDVYYGGSKEQWRKISVGDFNQKLTGANIHYNSTISSLPSFPAPVPTETTIPTPKPTGTHIVFTDVPDWCSEAATWGAAAGITNGTGGTKFSPDERCTNAQIITFLWRALGRPATTATAPYTNVESYYQEALNWAYGEWQIDDHFAPNLICNRLNAVKYIWQVFGSPYADGDSFTDMGRYSPKPAVYWAVEKGLTNGTSSTTFSPGKQCTRGEIITFLYRAFT